MLKSKIHNTRGGRVSVIQRVLQKCYKILRQKKTSHYVAVMRGKDQQIS